MMCHRFFFFFFKQKTAYEMRISDWSSDVCSSDLAADRAAAAVEEHDAHARRPCQRGQLHLGELQRPARGHQAAVLGAVGVAEHHRLPVAAGAQVGAIDGVVEQRAHHRRRSEEHTSELPYLMRISYDDFCLTNKK